MSVTSSYGLNDMSEKEKRYIACPIAIAATAQGISPTAVPRTKADRRTLAAPTATEATSAGTEAIRAANHPTNAAGLSEEMGALLGRPPEQPESNSRYRTPKYGMKVLATAPRTAIGTPRGRPYW